MAGLTREDVRRFHETYHGPGRAACIVAGDVDPAEVARGGSTNAWPTGRVPPLPPLP